MGSVSLKIGDGTARFKPPSCCSSALNVVMLISVLTTNLFALYAFTYHRPHQTPQKQSPHKNMSAISEHVSLILREIDFAQKKLAQMEKELLGYQTIDLFQPKTPNELKTFLQRHALPLGKDSKSGITDMVSSVGHSCAKSTDLIYQFMNYKVGGACPADSHVAQKLISRGCEPLPRRRCFVRSIPKKDLLPFPLSLWKPVSERSLGWSGVSCKSFECLRGKKLGANCDGCFDLSGGFERQRWIKARGKNDFLIEDVLKMANGNIRIGFDFDGSSGSFAARMAEKNVTIITSTFNLEAPFNEFIAARGLFPILLSADHRFPFHDGVLDLVHTMNGFGDGRPQDKMEFLMFDTDRILRPGGFFWLDNFLCVDDNRKNLLSQLIEKFGYKKLKWVVGEKTDSSGAGKRRIYLSALLQKPARR